MSPRSLHPTILVTAVILVAWTVIAPAAETQSSRTLRAPSGVTLSYPPAWVKTPRQYANVVGLIRVPASALGTVDAVLQPRVYLTTEQRLDHDDAIQRLVQIELERDTEVTYFELGGWPALRRRYEAPLERPGRLDPAGPIPLIGRWVTIAVAAGDTVVRVQGFAPPDSPVSVLDEIEAMTLTLPIEGDSEAAARDIARLNAGDLQRALRSSAGEGEPSGAPAENQPEEGDGDASDESGQGGLPGESQDGDGPGLVQRLNTGGTDSEIEIAVSTDGQHIVVANNGRDYAVSNDGGVTFTTAVAPGIPGGGANGDPSLAFAASGSFYFGFIGFPSGTQCSTGIHQSTDNGQTFTFAANATLCDEVNGPTCFPDQEHIAADRFNLSGGGQDQVYSAWRDFSGGGCGNIPIAGPEIPSLVCSTDGGANWTAKIAVGNAGDAYPRITVGSDGFVYVVYRAGNNLMLNKYSSCDSGLTQQAGFPVTIAAGISRVTCPAIPGIDRCNNGSDLSSHTVAVDDTDAAHLYAAYAVSTNANVNENVLVRDSTDGGATWPGGRVVQLNANVNGRRFMPWVCAVDGEACVSWYDMRAATPAQNDLADFFGGSAFVDNNNDLVAGPEFQISTATDALCASGWPAAPRNVQDSESCSIQPQLAGVCIDTSGNPTGARCDFSDCGTGACNAPSGVGGACQCNTAAGEVCGCGGGVPKYGDYNGSACAAGRFYTAWASATSPPDISPPSTNIDVFFSIEKNEPPIAVCQDVTRSADGSCQAAVAPEEVDGGSSDPEGFPLTFSLSPPGPYPLGDTVVTLTVADDRQETDTCEATITVEDDSPPEVTAPAPITLECNSTGGVPLGDPDVQAWLAMATAVDNCDGSLPVDNDAPPLFPSACPPGQATMVTFSATDSSDNTGTDTSSITVQDTTPPDLACSVQVDELWPPNHKWTDVGLDVVATDTCDGAPPSISIGVTSDEHPATAPGSGGPNHCPDAIVGTDGSVQLRAERSGAGDGRVYSINVTATDSCGNVAACSTQVGVPHHPGPGGGPIDSGQLYDAEVCD